MAPSSKKTRAAPAARAAKPNPRSTSLDSKLMLLWICFKNKQGTVNWKTVGEEYGISSTAAQYRLYRLRDYMEGLSSPGKKAIDTEMDSDDNDLGDNTTSGKATAKSKKPKATATYSDDEDEPLDDKSTLMDVKKATQEDSENDEKSTVFDSDLTGPSIKEEYEDTKEYYEVV